MKKNTLQKTKFKLLKDGVVIPALPLALTKEHTLDEMRQKTLIRYYLASGVGGLAVAVHTTQFEIRDDKELHLHLLRLAEEEVSSFMHKTQRTIVLIGGIRGNKEQAESEAKALAELGYDIALVCPTPGQSQEELLQLYIAAAKHISIFGFYLQTAIGGPELPYAFWRKALEIPELVGIKVAPFDRYKTLEVLRAVSDSNRFDEIALYTGNDDSIVLDLLTHYRFSPRSKPVHFSGGLLGHWCVWTRTAALLLEEIKAARANKSVPAELLTRAMQVTDANGAFFDAAHNFKGSIAGLHEVLRRQGFLDEIRCLNPAERLSAHQSEEIDRVYVSYPHLHDDEFIREHIGTWKS